nr:DUF5979 domain-containing protein [Leifsonia sp. C5G2]
MITAPALVLGVTVAASGAPARAEEAPSTQQPAAPAPAAPSTTPSSSPPSASASPTPSAETAPAPAPAPAPAAPSQQAAPSQAAAAPEVAALAAGDPVLTITKVVVNTGGGTATPSSWTYTLTGKRNNGNDVSPAVGYTFQSGVARSVTATATTGNGASVLRTYSITESGGPGSYVLSGIVCTGATANGTFSGGTLAGLQLHAGDTASCTITNTYQAPPTASIVVRAGGQRTGAATVGALPDGAVYQAVPVGGGAAATCALVSGQCTLSVPAGAAYTVSAQTAAPGYYLSPSLDVGGSSSGSPTTYAFRTGTLAANSTTTVPGTDVTSVYTDANGNRFSGMLAQSLQNPAVQQMCGLRIALVLDQSGSMAGAKQTALKAAANDVVTSLTGTPSTLAVYTFSDTTGPSIAATSTASASAAQPLHTFINGLATPSGYTNWDRGLGQVGSGFDLVILLTDGNPTTYAGGTVDGSNARIAYVEQGMFSANRIKGALGERLVAVGIGVDGGEENLRAVSGPAAGSDYFAESDTGFGDTLKQLATGSCSNTVTVQKRIETASGTIVDNSPAANGWNFSGSVSSGTIDAFAPTATQNGSTGFTSAPVGVAAGSSPTVSLTETPQPGYTLDRANSSCRVDGQSVAIGGSGTTISFTGAAGVAMSCVFVNKQVQTYGTFSVTKHVTGDGAQAAAGTGFAVHYSYPAGAGYAAGSGDLSITDGATATSPNLPTGAVVTLTEAAPAAVPGATWGTPSFAPSSTVTIAANTTTAVTLTNPITHDTGSFDVRKAVAGDAAGLVGADAQFRIHYQWDAAADGSFPAGDGSLTIRNDGVVVAGPRVPVGASVVLGELPAAPVAGASLSDVSFAPDSPLRIADKDATIHVVVTNTYTLNRGTFSVAKHLSGDAGLVPGDTPFTVDYSYPAGSGYPSGSGHLTVTPDGGAVRSDPLPQGAVVHLSEAARPPIANGTWGDPVFSANDIVIGDGTDVAIALTNPISHDTGTISVVKSVAGDGSGAVPADAAFTVAYRWEAAPNGGYPAGDGTITVHNDGVAVEIPDVPVGAAVTLTEGAHPSFPGVGWRSGTFSPAGPVVVEGDGQTVAVTLTNVYTVDTGGFTIAKRVSGDGAYLAPSGAVFTVHYSYTGGIAGRPGAGTLGLIAGVPQSVTGLPAGAVVTFQEDAPAAVPGGTWGDPVFDPAPLTIDAGGDATVTVQNPLAEIHPTLQLEKIVTDEVLPPTDWVLTGTGDYSPTVTDPDGGGTAAVAVRTGAAYTLSEAPKAGADGTGEFAAGEWTCTDTAGGSLTVDRTGPGAATLRGLSAGQAVVCTVTNTHQDQGVRLQKTLAGPATQNPDGTWTIGYTLAVANRSALAATTYDLADALHFGGGIVVQQATWSGPTSGAFSGTTATLAQGAALAAGQTADFTVSVTATVGASAWRDRTTDCPDGSGDGGFLNTATVTSAGETSSSSACDSPGTLTVRKTAGEVAQGPQGHVTIGYDIVVSNTTPKPQFYDLADTPQPAPGATVVSATATKNGDPVPYDGGTLASGAGIGGGSPEHPVTDHYTVTLEVDVAAFETAQATCDGASTGLFNAATLSTGSITTEADACADLPTGTITLVKTVAAGFGGDQRSDAWTLTAAGSSGRTISGRYTASDPDPAITKVVVPTGSYALTEGPAIPGYALTGLTCADAKDGAVAVRGGAVELAPGMDLTCTFTNTPRPAHLTLIKEVADPDGSGTTRTPHDWTLTATPAFDGFEPVSGRGDPQRPDGVSSVAVWAGRYDLSESGPSGFAAGRWTCEGASVDGSAVTIPLGADVTCTITNTAALPRLTLVKVVDNGDTGGRGVPSDWIVSAAGPTFFGGPGSDDPSQPDPAITHIGAAVGDYTLSEDASAAPAGYELAGLSCTNTVDGTVLDTTVADPTLHLAEGDDVVCTFTNRAIPAAWTLSKTSNRGATVMPGDVIRYELTLTHTAGVLPRLLLLRDIDDLSGVTPHAAFVPGSLSASSGAATLQDGRLDWTLTDLSGGALTVAYSFRVAQDAWGVTLRNALTPPRDVTCPEGTCETTSSTPDLELWKTATVTSKADPADPTRVLPGGTVAYTLSAHNPTAVDLPAGQTETDDVSGLTGRATLGALGAGLSRDGSDRLTWTLPAVPAGATVSVGYTATVADDAAGSTLTNTLVPGTGHCLPPADDGPSCTTSNDVPRIDLGMVKTASTEGPVDDDPGASSEYAYTLTVTNHGDTAATDAVVTDVLPEQIDLDVEKGSGGFDDVPAGWTPAFDPATSTVTVRIPSLAVGGTAAIRIHVLVRPVVHGSVDAPVGAVPPGQDGPDPVTPPATIDNRACVAVAEDVDPSNDCSAASVPQSAVAANVWVQCQADVPYLHYDVRTTPNLSGEPVTLQWTPSQPGTNGVPASDLAPDPAGVTRTLHDGDSGTILWPGAAVDGDGVGVGFPGWRPIAESDYDASGALRFPPAQVFEGLVYDPSTVATDAWRYPSTVTIRVNPTETYTVVYPPAATACAVARVAKVGIVKTASTPLTHPGGTFGYTLQVDDLGLGAADPVTLTDPIPADLRVDSIATDTTAFPRWQDCAVVGSDGDGFGGTLTCTLFGPLSASAPSAPEVNVRVTVRTGTAASSISNTASVCSRHQGDAAAVTECAQATAVVYLSVATLLAATGLDLSAAGGLALALLASGALLWTVLLRRRRRYADIGV